MDNKDIKNICVHAKPDAPKLFATSTVKFNLAAPSEDAQYENPWAKDGKNASCNNMETALKIDGKDKTFGICMPPVRVNFGNCERPPSFDAGNEGILTRYHNGLKSADVCVEECSLKQSGCQNGAQCIAAPASIKSDSVKMICAYVQPKAKSA